MYFIKVRLLSRNLCDGARIKIPLRRTGGLTLTIYLEHAVLLFLFFERALNHINVKIIRCCACFGIAIEGCLENPAKRSMNNHGGKEGHNRQANRANHESGIFSAGSKAEEHAAEDENQDIEQDE